MVDRTKEEPIILLGAGLAGSLCALYLAQRGYRVEVYERRPDMRKANISAGKSINLALSVRGLTALEGVGMKEEILKLCLPMYGRVMHARDREITYQSYSKDGKWAINSVSRGGLNIKLMDAAEQFEHVNFHFNYRCLGMDFDKGEVYLKNEKTQKKETVSGQMVIGADGAFSGLRSSMMKTPLFSYSQDYLSHGYKELTIPPTEDGKHKIADNALHIWPRGEYMLIALPNLDGSFTVTLFYPFEGENSFDALDTKEKVDRFFRNEFPDAFDLIPGLAEEYFENPKGSLVTVRCAPWSVQNKAILMGDAAHAVVPFFGQGMNAAFEDCRVLNDCVTEFKGNWEKIIPEYQKRRIDNANAIADMAIENYIEMRDSVADPRWLKRKKLEHFLGTEFPEKYVARYELVSFSNIPYAEAYKEGEMNDKVLDELMDRNEAGLPGREEALATINKYKK